MAPSSQVVVFAYHSQAVEQAKRLQGIANFSILKNQKAKAIRLSTLNDICEYLDCQPGDILVYESDDEAPDDKK